MDFHGLAAKDILWGSTHVILGRNEDVPMGIGDARNIATYRVWSICHCSMSFCPASDERKLNTPADVRDRSGLTLMEAVDFCA